MTFRKYIKEIIYWISILTLFGSFMVYGLGKTNQFGYIESAKSVDKLSGQELMWVFYGYSKLYPIVIGIFEVCGGIALLFQRTRIFGCILLSSILFNIIIQDYVYDVVALPSAIYYQILIIIILLYDYPRLLAIFNMLFTASKQNKTNILIILIAIIFSVILKFFETKILQF